MRMKEMIIQKEYSLENSGILEERAFPFWKALQLEDFSHNDSFKSSTHNPPPPPNITTSPAYTHQQVLQK